DMKSEFFSHRRHAFPRCRSAILALVLLVSAPGQAQEARGMRGLILEPVLLTDKAPRLPLTEPPVDESSVDTETAVTSALAYEDAIRTMESSGDLLNPELIERYDALGTAYQALDRHEQAIA